METLPADKVSMYLLESDKEMKMLWHRLFLEERPSVGLSFFRIAAAVTTAFHVIPTLCQLPDNYFPTAFKTFNPNFFPLSILGLVQKSPEWVIVLFVWIFCLSCFCFLIGFFSQISCIVMTLSCYYFYALNAFHVGTLSWDILLVTLFLMCVTNYHGDSYSLDSLIRTEEFSYQRKRPFFIQRLLQLQIGFTFFYTALYKTTAEGNWIKDNPMYYLMNTPYPGVVKTFLLRDFLMDKPQICYTIGIAILLTEYFLIFLLFYRRTRISAIYLGIFFHIVLILTFDVPAIFFFLFPAQLCLFLDPQRIVDWIEEIRKRNSTGRRDIVIYDGKCHFCLKWVAIFKVMDWFGAYQWIDLHGREDLAELHLQLNNKTAQSQIHLIDINAKLTGGFNVIKKMSFVMPMLYPFIFIFYFPAMGIIGPAVYKLVAKNRFLFHRNSLCKSNSCYR